MFGMKLIIIRSYEWQRLSVRWETRTSELPET